MVGVVEEGMLMTSGFDAMRASDDDRERVVQAMQEQVGLGRLDLPEFEERSTRAYAATTVGELREIVADLPLAHLFPRQQSQLPPWEQPMGLPAVPPWQYRRAPLPRGRRVSPLTVVSAVLAVLLVINVVGYLAGALAGVVFPFLPLIFVLFILGRRSGGPGRHYR